MGVYGLGRGVQSFFQGMDDADNIAYIKQQREQEQIDRDRRIRNEDYDRLISKEDRGRRIAREDYALNRTKTLDARNDEKYDLDKKQKAFARTLDTAIAQFNVSNDPSLLQGLYNKRYPDGGTIQITPADDGTYSVVHTDAEGKVSKQDGLTKDQVGIMAFSMRDPKAYIDYRIKQSAEKSKQKAELYRLDREYQHKKDVEAIKNGGKGGAGSKADKEYRLRVQQGLGVLQSHYGGKFEGGIWFPDDGNKDEGLAAQAIMESMVRDQGVSPVNAARDAAKVSGKIYSAARAKAKQRAETSGNDSPEQIEKETRLIANILVKKYMGNKAPGNASTGRSGSTKPDKGKTHGLERPKKEPKKQTKEPTDKKEEPKPDWFKDEQSKKQSGSRGAMHRKKEQLDKSRADIKSGMRRHKSTENLSPKSIDNAVKQVKSAGKGGRGRGNLSAKLEKMDARMLRAALKGDLSDSMKRKVIEVLDSKVGSTAIAGLSR